VTITESLVRIDRLRRHSGGSRFDSTSSRHNIFLSQRSSESSTFLGENTLLDWETVHQGLWQSPWTYPEDEIRHNSRL